MIQLIKDIMAARERCGLTTQSIPAVFDAAEFERYREFLKEEFYTEAGEANGLLAPSCFEHLADAMADGAVFMAHMCCIQGLGPIMDDVWKEVLYSNSTKGGENGEVFDENFKLIKGPNYKRPNLKQFFSGKVTLLITGANSKKLIDFYKMVCDECGWRMEQQDIFTIIIEGNLHYLYSAFRGEVGRHMVDGCAVVVQIITENFRVDRQWSNRPFIRRINDDVFEENGDTIPLTDWRKIKLPLSEV